MPETASSDEKWDRIAIMFRWTTAGESHGQALIALVEDMPAGVPITEQEIAHQLARRRLGYGRGARMKFEQDKLELLAGVVRQYRVAKVDDDYVSASVGYFE